LLPKLLKPGGVYSFFNGFCPDNIFFQGVACQVRFASFTAFVSVYITHLPVSKQVVQMELAGLGISTKYVPTAVDCRCGTINNASECNMLVTKAVIVDFCA